jgi:hypothetical protein
MTTYAPTIDQLIIIIDRLQLHRPTYFFLSLLKCSWHYLTQFLSPSSQAEKENLYDLELRV